MIQDILPQKLYNTFVRKEPLPDSRILSFRGGQAYYRERDGEIMFLSFRRVNEYYEEKGQELPEAVFLFSVDTQDYFLMDLGDILIERYTYHKMKPAGCFRRRMFWRQQRAGTCIYGTGTISIVEDAPGNWYTMINSG